MSYLTSIVAIAIAIAIVAVILVAITAIPLSRAIPSPHNPLSLTAPLLCCKPWKRVHSSPPHPPHTLPPIDP